MFLHHGCMWFCVYATVIPIGCHRLLLRPMVIKSAQLFVWLARHPHHLCPLLRQSPHSVPATSVLLDSLATNMWSGDSELSARCAHGFAVLCFGRGGEREFRNSRRFEVSLASVTSPLVTLVIALYSRHGNPRYLLVDRWKPPVTCVK